MSDTMRAADIAPCHCGRPWVEHALHFPEGATDPLPHDEVVERLDRPGNRADGVRTRRSESPEPRLTSAEAVLRRLGGR